MSTQYKAFTGNAVIVDLSGGSVDEYEITDKERAQFLGNKSLAAKILYDCLEPGLDPLSPDNHIVVSTAALTGTGAPCSSRFNVSTKGPLTGIILSSNCGGNFGIHMKRAGFDVLIVKGRAKKPSYLLVEDGKVTIKDAADLWGKDTEVTQEEFANRHGKRCGNLVIGPAGENLVRYACMISNERAIGRGGSGAVMGSKNLKGMVSKGTGKIEVFDKEGFKKSVQEWTKFLKAHPVTGKSLPDYGTDGLLLKASTLNCLPTENFKFGTYEDANLIDGEYMAENILVKNDGCLSCPIRCARVVEFEGKNVKGPEFETVGMFGSNIRNNDIRKIARWNVIMDRLGIDTITAGGTLGFVMEATREGLMKSDLEFGKTDNIEKTLYDIAYRKGQGNELAEGVMRLSEKYGGKSFAMHAKGLEFAAYEPRGAVGHGLGYATANRGGCHLNAGYLVYFEALGPVNIHPLKAEGKAEFVVFQQNTLEAISACGCCIFTSYAVIPGIANKLTPYSDLANILSKLTLASAPLIGMMTKLPAAAVPFHLPIIHHSKVIAKASGQKMSTGEFLTAGARGFNMERMFNVREGMVDDSLPARLTDEPQIKGRPDTVVPMDKMLPKYYKIRGWDDRGVPLAKVLKSYGLNFAVSDIPPNEVSKQDLLDKFYARRFEYEKTQTEFIAQTLKENQKLSKPKAAPKKAAVKKATKKAAVKKTAKKKPAKKVVVKKAAAKKTAAKKTTKKAVVKKVAKKKATKKAAVKKEK